MENLVGSVFVELHKVNINNRASPVKKLNFVLLVEIPRENVILNRRPTKEGMLSPWIFFIQVEEVLKNILYFLKGGERKSRPFNTIATQVIHG
jgi:hypothetical protein